MRYRPAPSVLTVRLLSISTGLLTSIIAPAIAAPDESVTMPPIAAWAAALHGTPATHASSRKILTQRAVGLLGRVRRRTTGRATPAASAAAAEVRLQQMRQRVDVFQLPVLDSKEM